VRTPRKRSEKKGAYAGVKEPRGLPEKRLTNSYSGKKTARGGFGRIGRTWNANPFRRAYLVPVQDTTRWEKKGGSEIKKIRAKKREFGAVRGPAAWVGVIEQLRERKKPWGVPFGLLPRKCTPSGKKKKANGGNKEVKTKKKGPKIL